MAFVEVRVEWRRGVNGDQGTFIFDPKPSITRPVPGRRIAEHVIPLLDGEIVQNLGKNKRIIQLQGALFNKSNSWDDIEQQREELVDGLEVGPGQLHLISPDRHLRYDGQITVEGVQFDEQERSNLQDYSVTILVPSGEKLISSGSVHAIQSDAEIT